MDPDFENKLYRLHLLYADIESSLKNIQFPNDSDFISSAKEKHL